VDRRVFTPRPETEYMVEISVSLIRKYRTPGRECVLVDMCCGSGAISIAIKKEFPDVRVVACDNSPDALQVCYINALMNKLKIEIVNCDILKAGDIELLPSRVNFVVGNPPYVCPWEWIDKNVLDEDPMEALMNPGIHPVEFYRSIFRYGADTISHGFVIVETSPSLIKFVREVAMGTFGKAWSIYTADDYAGRERYLIAEKNHETY